jgi:hypothetical protein
MKRKSKKRNDKTLNKRQEKKEIETELKRSNKLTS